ncbi:penicillin acylase family protein [Fretibacter rubidus]|uniref:penicillin acylase family protein n=1 Tax=Fretibacter rubidus TaxID=570162 RepID=UPI00352ACD2A
MGVVKNSLKMSLIMGAALGGLSLSSCSPADTPKTAAGAQLDDMTRWAETAARVTIMRDDYGVPHIYGKTDADAVFGLLYAQAEDDFPRIERNYIWATGRLAEIEGKSALYSDLRARLYMTVDEAKAAYAAAPPMVKALCDAWADGLNYYLAKNPDVTPALITTFEPWMPMFFSEGSIGGDIEQIPLGGITAFYGDGTPRPAPRTVALEAEPGGSNGFAIAGKLTRSGDAMLLINPHTSFYFRPEVHVISEEGLNAYGAVTWGQFFVYQGFNANNGWMHTSTYVDFMDEFTQDVFETDGQMFYHYGDESRPLKVGSVTLKFKDGQGMSTRTFPTYHTHHGPITHMDADGKWVATKINWDPVNALRQSFTRTKTTDLDGFNAMMDIRRNSSNNTVYADKDGNIGYYHGNFVPKRDVRFDYSKAVDGANPATDWQGLHEVSEIVTLFNPENGWIQNCNSTPFTAAMDYSPKPSDYAPYMAPDKENTRGLNAVRVLKDANDVTLDSLIELAYDPYLPAFEMIIPSLTEAYARSNKNPKYADAIAALNGWDYQTSTGSVPMAIAHFYGMEMLRADSRPKGASRLETYIHYRDNGTDAEQLAMLGAAMDKMTADFGDWNIPWGEVNRFQRLSGSIGPDFDDAQPSLPVGLASGRWGALAAYGARAYDNTKKLYGYRGNSFVAVVEFGDTVKAKSLLAGGQSGDPNSPHFFDQGQRYAEAAFKDVAYYKDDVTARAVRSYRPGE